MDSLRFDRWTRLLGRGVSRRATLGGLWAALLPGALAAKPNANARRKGDSDREPKRQPDAARCVANGQRCGTGSGKKGKKDTPCKHCCSKYGTPKAQGPQRCSCKPNRTACANNAQCCGGQCTGGHCGPCTPGLTLCQPDGCVDVQTSDAHCGTCPTACASNQVCQAGSCACTVGSCPDGCCAGDLCKPGTGDAFCGVNGDSCTACPPGSRCCGGACCAGCCDAGVCKTGDTDGACGAGGTACATCGAGQDCHAGVCTCNGASCSGCCDGNTCRAGDTKAFCGTGGAACDPCTVGEVCAPGGVCVAPPCGEPGGACLVFVTSTAQTGNLGGLDGADLICQNLADAAALPGTYMAWLSDSTGSPSSRFTRAPGPYLLVNRDVVADDWDDLTTEKAGGAYLTNAITITETGDEVTESLVTWSDTAPGGTVDDPGLDYCCYDWTVDGFSSGLAGQADTTTEYWTGGILVGCPFLNRLYCFQQG